MIENKVIGLYHNSSGQLYAANPFLANVNRTWILNDTSTANFSVPETDTLFTDTVSEGTIVKLYGYRVPPWVGLVKEIDYQDGYVNVGLKSAETLLQKKIGPQRVQSSANINNPEPIGNAARQIYNHCIAKYPIPILPGLFDASSVLTNAIWEYPDAWETLVELAEKANAQFWVDDDLKLNFRNGRGLDRRAYTVLYENRHLQINSVKVNYDDIVTNVIGVGKGSDLASSPKAGAAYPYPGIWNSVRISASEANTPAEVRGQVVNYLLAHSIPTTTVDATLVFWEPSWGAIGLGDYVQLVIYRGALGYVTAVVQGLEAGPEGTVRVIFRLVPTTGIAISDWYPV